MIEAAGLVNTGELQIFDRVRDLLQVLPRQMQIPRCRLQIFMTEQKLDRTQVRARFEQMGRPAVANQMGRDPLADTCPFAAWCKFATQSCR